jgi:alkyl hydroperoxide reductase subunit AhpC
LSFFSYPLDFTFVCPTEIIAFSNAHERLKAIGAEIVGRFRVCASPVTSRSAGFSVTFPLIGDLGANISKLYGFYLSSAGHDLRGTAIIEPDGIVQPDVGRNIDEVLRLVQGDQFHREQARPPGEQVVLREALNNIRRPDLKTVRRESHELESISVKQGMNRATHIH